MAETKKARKISARPQRAAAVARQQRIDFGDVSLKQIAAAIGTIGVIVVTLSVAFGWYFNANQKHEMTEAHDHVISEYETIWDESRTKRKAEIAEAEAYYRENRRK